MLVLSRKAGQEIVIDERVVVSVISVGRNGVRLGFTAPHDVRIHRQEIRERIEQEELAAREAKSMVHSADH